MQKLFVPYDLAVQLKKKGFKEPTLGHYYERDGQQCLVVYGEFPPDSKNWLPAPLYQQVIDWLREKHKIHVAASTFPVYNDQYGIQYTRSSLSSGWEPLSGKTYYEALNNAIIKGLTLLK